jgi:hypothetical protein
MPTIVEPKTRQLAVVGELYAVTPNPETPGRVFTTKTEAEAYERDVANRWELPAPLLIIPIPLFGYR